MVMAGEVAAKCWKTPVSITIFMEEGKGHIGFAYDWRVPRVIGVVQQPVIFRLHNRLDSFKITMRNGVSHCGEGLHTPGERPVGMTENRQGRLGQLASQRD